MDYRWIVDRYGGDHRVRTLSCAEQYRSMAFAQLTYRESLRDIETCLSVHASKLYHMGFRQPVRRSTLADANERRDWRIHAALAQRLITQARTLYVDEELGLDLTNTVYALDSTTIALCLSVFPWAHFRTTKAAVKMHTLLDLRGNIPSFIHISDGKLHDDALDMLLPEAGAIYVVDRGYVDFARLYVFTKPGPSVTRAKSNIDAHRVGADGSLDRHHLRPDHLPGRLLHPSGLPRTSAAHPLQGPRVRQDAGLHHQQLLASGRHHLRALQKPLAGGTLLQVDQAASSRFYGSRRTGEDADLECYVVAIVKKRLTWTPRSTLCYRSSSVTLFEQAMPIHQALAGDENRCNASQITNQLNLFDF